MSRINLDDLTLREIREIQALLPPVAAPTLAVSAPLAPHPYAIGDAVFIRTVTYHYTGRIVAIYSGEIVLAEAAWIAESGRWSVALATGTLSEVEPYPGEVVISRGAVVDITRWLHPLPRSAK